MINPGIFAGPVARRELQIAARNPALYRHRTIVSACATIVAVLCIHSRGSGLAVAGRTLFNLFIWGSFLLCLLETMRSAADAISGEKREGTLGLLFLTDLRTADVVLGKFTFVAIRSFVFLIPILPTFAVPLLLGGVTAGECWRAMMALLFTAILGLSAALFASSLSVSSTAALARTAVILMFMTVQPVLLALNGRPPWPPPADWIAGPLAMMAAVDDARFVTNPASFWLAAVFTGILSVVMLAAAGYFTRRRLSSIPVIPEARWWQRWLQPRRGYVATWGEGSDQSPAVWLAARTLPGQRILWILISVGLVGCLAAGLFGVAAIAVGLQLVFGVLFKFWVAVVAAQSLHELRKTGALELILCTPIQPRSIVQGHVDLFYEAFMGPALAIAVGFPVALFGGAALVQRTHMSDPSIMVPMGMMWLVYTILDVHALGYLGMWHGLATKRVEGAIGKTAWYGLIVPWLFVVVPIIGWLALLFWPIIIIHWATSRLNSRFHEPLTAT